MIESPAALTFLLSNDRKAAIIRSAHRERAAAFAAVGYAIAGGIRRLFTRKPAMRIGAQPAGFAR